MKNYRRVILFFVILVFCAPFCRAEAGPFIAYSLKEAEQRLAGAETADRRITELGGMTNPLAMIYDEANQDIILVGRVEPGAQKVMLDDFVVALRAKFLHKTCPTVSIDKTPDSFSTRMQKINFTGGIANTQFGRDLLAADVLLKKIGLRKIRADVWGVKSYFDLYAQHWQESGLETAIESRFWFIPSRESTVSLRDGVGVVRKLKVKVLTEVLSTTGNGGAPADPVGDMFSDEITRAYQDISVQFQELRRLNTLFKLVGIAEAIEESSQRDTRFKPAFNYWLYQHQVHAAETPQEYPLLTTQQDLTRGGAERTQTINGGVRLKALMSDLADGVAQALRDIVILSRPAENAVCWLVPLEGWNVSDAPEEAIQLNEEATEHPAPSPIGCWLDRSITAPGKTGQIAVPASADCVAFKGIAEKQAFTFTNQFPATKITDQVGGVMLRETAQVANKGQTAVDLSSGNFSLIVDGKNAQLDPGVFGKFITALWSVYYSADDPGISIDPIGPGISKHLVRYIGKVINNDLGRVMREADYTMKKWAVGTIKPDIDGFKNVDDLSARYGLGHIGASRRFWFVPEHMTFKECDGALLFDSGRMTLKTEYVLKNLRVKAAIADEEFANAFTNNYSSISGKYTIYRELFEYAKMVSLAKYLKVKGVPLLWFMLANKDKVITEDSPGTVEALAKGSKYFEGLYIEGGVDLKFDPLCKGNYVQDAGAAEAISNALHNVSGKAGANTGVTYKKMFEKFFPDNFSFDVPVKNREGQTEKINSYTVIPQHSLTTGKDTLGIRYQTDVAFKSDYGPGLELVRYFNPNNRDSGEFGDGWHLLIPYRVEKLGERRIEFLNAMIPEKMVVKNLITGQKDALSFSKDRYSIAGYVPDNLSRTDIIGLFILSDGSFRLADKVGNEFQFDQSGCLTEMIFSEDYRIKIEYGNDEATGPISSDSYRLIPAGNEKREFASVEVYSHLKIINQATGFEEVLSFSERNRCGIAGYIPDEPERSPYTILALMSDASYVLSRKDGLEITFDPSGRFNSLKARVIKGISQGAYHVAFAHDYINGQPCITEARVEKENQSAPMYTLQYGYDQEGKLCSIVSDKNMMAQNLSAYKF